MTIIERLELIRAGYKRAEIDAMIKADEEAQKAPPKEEPKQEEPKKPPEQPKEQKAPPKEEPKQTSEVDSLKAELAELKKKMQLQNIQKIGLDTPPKKAVEEVLAEAIFGNPEKK